MATNNVIDMEVEALRCEALSLKAIKKDMSWEQFKEAREAIKERADAIWAASTPSEAVWNKFEAAYNALYNS